MEISTATLQGRRERQGATNREHRVWRNRGSFEEPAASQWELGSDRRRRRGSPLQPSIQTSTHTRASKGELGMRWHGMGWHVSLQSSMTETRDAVMITSLQVPVLDQLKMLNKEVPQPSRLICHQGVLGGLRSLRTISLILLSFFLAFPPMKSPSPQRLPFPCEILSRTGMRLVCSQRSSNLITVFPQGGSAP